jgi:hypothetical protein
MLTQYERASTKYIDDPVNTDVEPTEKIEGSILNRPKDWIPDEAGNVYELGNGSGGTIRDKYSQVNLRLEGKLLDPRKRPRGRAGVILYT